jgi:hypothetical protein
MSSVIRGSDNFDSLEAVSGRALAWINFNGIGSVAIRSSYNVSSITDNGTGDYTVSFIDNMVDTDYSVSMSSQYSTGTVGGLACQTTGGSNAVGSVPVRTSNSSAASANDALSVYVQIFGNS